MKIIIFDIPTEKRSLARKVQRHLNSIQAEMVQQSVWRSSNLQKLKEITSEIKNNGGRAMLLNEDVVMDYFSF